MSTSAETGNYSFDDDEPLPETSSSRHPSVDIPKIKIEMIPESQAVLASRSVSPFYVLVRLKAPSMSEYPHELRLAPIDLVVVIDVSRSMQRMIIISVKIAIQMVIRFLKCSDRLSIVVFSSHAVRLFPLRVMSESGKIGATQALKSMGIEGGNSLANVMEGLRMGVKVLHDRRYKNRFASIIFFSYEKNTSSATFAQVFPNPQKLLDFPIYTFGLGPYHDVVAMHDISNASAGGTYSFIESCATLIDAIISCLAGLLSVVAQKIRIKLVADTLGVKIVGSRTGRYGVSIEGNGHLATVTIGDLYADEEREFLFSLQIPKFAPSSFQRAERDWCTTLPKILCIYHDALLPQVVLKEYDVDIHRPTTFQSLEDGKECREVKLLHCRSQAANYIAKAKRDAENGVLSVAKAYLSKNIATLVFLSSQSDDSRCYWMIEEMLEIRKRMGNVWLYNTGGRAYMLSHMSSNSSQRAATRGNRVPGNYGAGATFDAYATPQISINAAIMKQFF